MFKTLLHSTLIDEVCISYFHVIQTNYFNEIEIFYRPVIKATDKETMKSQYKTQKC